MNNTLPTAALPTATLFIRAAGERTEKLCKKLILEQCVPESWVFVVREVPFFDRHA
jgi:hypothetical protein